MPRKGKDIICDDCGSFVQEGEFTEKDGRITCNGCKANPKKPMDIKKKEKPPTYENVTDEFRPVLEKFYKNQPLMLNVEPDKIMILKCFKKKNSDVYADTRMVHGIWEYLISGVKYFITIYEDNCKLLTPERIEYVLLHEYYHCVYITDTEKYALRKHNVMNFGEMLKDPNWNVDIINQKAPDLE